MGFFSTGRKVEEAKMAQVGKYLFERLSDDEKQQVLELANYRLQENDYPKSVDQLEDKVQWVFWALAMAELGFEHGLNQKWFRWRHIDNPFMITTLEDAHWKTAAEILSKKNKITITYP